MSKEQARALLALIADLYMICNGPEPEPEPEPEPAVNGQVPESSTIS